MNNEINIINEIAIEIKGERKSVNELLNNAVYERAFSACVRKALNEAGLNTSYYSDLFNDGVELLLSECIPNYRANNSDFLAYSLFIVKKRLQRVIAKKYRIIKIPDGERLKYIKAKKLINMLEISSSNYNEDEIKSILESNGIRIENMIKINSYEKMESLDNDEYESSSLHESISYEKIVHKGKYAEYSRVKSHIKPSEFCKETLKLPSVKTAEFIENYFSDIEDLLYAIKEYKRLSNIPKNEICLADLIIE